MKRICTIHNVELVWRDTKYGIRGNCPVPGCTVVMWGGPTSTPADAETRALRQKIHKAMDGLWHSARERKEIYKRLAHVLNISISCCHIGRFDSATCEMALDAITKGLLTKRKEKNGKLKKAEVKRLAK